jgi:hypothetical protein
METCSEGNVHASLLPALMNIKGEGKADTCLPHRNFAKKKLNRFF